jgi:hypothetical protein
MTIRTKEFAKFLAGVAATETFGHWWMGIWGGELLPMKLRWFTFTPELNWFATPFWPVGLGMLIYLAWLRRPTAADTASLAPVQSA